MDPVLPNNFRRRIDLVVQGPSFKVLAACLCALQEIVPVFIHNSSFEIHNSSFEIHNSSLKYTIPRF